MTTRLLGKHTRFLSFNKGTGARGLKFRWMNGTLERNVSALFSSESVRFLWRVKGRMIVRSTLECGREKGTTVAAALGSLKLVSAGVVHLFWNTPLEASLLRPQSGSSAPASLHVRTPGTRCVKKRLECRLKGNKHFWFIDESAGVARGIVV